MRGGTLVIAGQREPACLNVLLAACGLVGVSNPVLEGAFELRPDYTYRPQLVSHVTVSKNPFTLTYHVRPAARWSDGTSSHRGGLRLHLPDRARLARGGAQKDSQRPRRRREDGEGRVPPRRALRRLACPALHGHPAAPRTRRCGARDHLADGHRQPEDGHPDRERPVPRRELGARPAADRRPQPTLLGGARRVSGPDRRPLRPVRRSSRTPCDVARSTSVQPVLRNCCGGRWPEWRWCPSPARPGSTSTSGSAAAATPHSRPGSCGRHSRTASTGRQSCGPWTPGSPARAVPCAGCSTAWSSRRGARSTGPTGRAIATGRASPAACSSGPAAVAGRTRSTCAPASVSRFVS